MAGRLAFRADNRDVAAAYFAMAQQLALEAGECQLRAMALAFRADLFSVVPYLGTMSPRIAPLPGNKPFASRHDPAMPKPAPAKKRSSTVRRSHT